MSPVSPILHTEVTVSNGLNYKVIIAQWIAQRLATGEVPGSNPSKGENLLIDD